MMLPTARAFIGDLCPKGEEGKWQGYGNAAFFSGFASGPLIGRLLAEGYGYNATFYAMLAFLPESGSRQMGRGYPSTKELFRVGLTSRMFSGLISYRIGFALARGCFFTFLPLLVASSLHIGTGPIGILMTSHYMVLAVSQLYFGPPDHFPYPDSPRIYLLAAIGVASFWWCRRRYCYSTTDSFIY